MERLGWVGGRILSTEWDEMGVLIENYPHGCSGTSPRLQPLCHVNGRLMWATQHYHHDTRLSGQASTFEALLTCRRVQHTVRITFSPASRNFGKLAYNPSVVCCLSRVLDHDGSVAQISADHFLRTAHPSAAFF